MNQANADRWKSQVLDEVFVALAASEQFDECLVFKGARVLNLRLGGGRQSLDLDSNLAAPFVKKHPDRETQRAFLEEQIAKAVRRHFEGQDPVRYELTAITVRTYPAKTHPLGWDTFKVKMNVNDLTRSVKGLPAIVIDVAAPEELLHGSVSTIEVGGYRVCAYTLERIAGEKLRAFLSSLPAYRAKVPREGEPCGPKTFTMSPGSGGSRRSNGSISGGWWGRNSGSPAGRGTSTARGCQPFTSSGK